jgi:hypothetical protein
LIKAAFKGRQTRQSQSKKSTRYKYRRDSVTGKLVRWVKPAAAG